LVDCTESGLITAIEYSEALATLTRVVLHASSFPMQKKAIVRFPDTIERNFSPIMLSLTS
jgi:predicted RNA-binding protein associated with RNAse of E/G family